jgi:hypothetical protein
MPPKPSIRLPESWEEILRRFGFHDANADYQMDGFAFRSDGQWITLEHAARSCAGVAGEPMDMPGLWKDDGDAATPRRCFESPAALIQDAETESDEPAARLTLESWLKWATGTADGVVPSNWPAPTGEQLADWVPPKSLSLQRGAFVRQGAWVLRPGRLALEFPVLFSVPGALSPARAAWLEALVREANDRWRLARFGTVPSAHGRALVARIDFSGAPYLPSLFSTGLEALKYGVAWVGESAELLADTERELAVLAAPPPNTQPRKE